MTFGLPSDLKYLEPILQDISRIGGDNLDESYDLSKLIAALQRRIVGLDHAEAEERIRSDRQLLLSWLQVHGDHPAIFIETIMAQDGLIDRLVERKPATAKKVEKRSKGAKKITVTVPNGFSSQRSGASLILINETATVAISVDPLSPEEKEKALAMLQRWPGSSRSACVLGGRPTIRVNAQDKQHFFFDVEGQPVRMTLDSANRSFDDVQAEALISSIHF